MKLLKVLSWLCVVTMAMVVALAGVLANLPAWPGLGPVKHFSDILFERFPIHQGNTVFYCFLLLLFFLIVYICLILMCSRSKPVVTIDSERGKIRIIDSAVRKYLTTSLSKMASIQVRSIQVSAVKKGLVVRVYVRVRSAQRLNDVRESIIERIRIALENELGVPAVANIEVIVDDFEAIRALSAKKAETAAATVTAETAEIQENATLETKPQIEEPIPSEEGTPHGEESSTSSVMNSSISIDPETETEVSVSMEQPEVDQNVNITELLNELQIAADQKEPAQDDEAKEEKTAVENTDENK